MRFAVLGSGSQGNGTLVAHDDTYVLVDCGFSLRETGSDEIIIPDDQFGFQPPKTALLV